MERPDTVMSCPLLDRALLHAAATNDLAAVNMLLDQGANVNARDDENVTALMRAAEGGHSAVLQILIARGADPHLKDRWGNTAVTRATREGHTEITRLLTEDG